MATTIAKPKQVLTGTRDLIEYFNLMPIYNKIVKPYPPPNRAEGLDSTLFPYTSDLPGKTDIEPDGYLINLLRDPQASESGSAIEPLDQNTLQSVFTLKGGPIPGFDYSIIGGDDAGYENGSSGHLTTSDNYSGILGDIDHNGERKHKKKKKKRKHGHEHDEDGHGDHKKKKKKRKDKEHRESLIVD